MIVGLCGCGWECGDEGVFVRVGDCGEVVGGGVVGFEFD